MIGEEQHRCRARHVPRGFLPAQEWGTGGSEVPRQARNDGERCRFGAEVGRSLRRTPIAPHSWLGRHPLEGGSRPEGGFLAFRRLALAGLGAGLVDLPYPALVTGAGGACGFCLRSF